LEEVQRVLRQYLGEEMRIAVEFVENIEMVKTGKRLATVSKLGIDFQNIKAS
jgi:phenylacetate-CoA ligase